MFVVSMKTTRPRVIVSLAVAAVLLATVVVLARSPAGQGAAAAAPIPAAGEEQRRAYLTGLGYELSPEAPEVQEVLIPADFDEEAAAYNALQQQAGMDLTAYRGRRVKCWTYTVTNYPGEDTVQAHLYVCRDRVIGGDISSTKQDGFRHGLLALTPGQDSTGPGPDAASADG